MGYFVSYHMVLPSIAKNMGNNVRKTKSPSLGF